MSPHLALHIGRDVLVVVLPRIVSHALPRSEDPVRAGREGIDLPSVPQRSIGGNQYLGIGTPDKIGGSAARLEDPIGNIIELRREERSKLGHDGRSISLHQCEILAARAQTKVGVKEPTGVDMVIAVLAGCED